MTMTMTQIKANDSAFDDVIDDVIAEINATIDNHMRPFFAQRAELMLRISALERRSDMWGQRCWTEPLHHQHPLMVEVEKIETQINALKSLRPVHPLHAAIQAEMSEAIAGRPSARIAELLRTQA
jgi:hypothetical protein